ncbi:RNA 2',3'-cyclic phosphodiesterase [Methanimicrococcus sp. OttesenSCG-928-J09]|nr:RNA 2',3'-cyclic phosphodiesterase [Methanimicrococcus sp. OttesenSCG-928-J09]
MRLFIAVHFPEEANQQFLKYMEILKENARGSFTKPQNLHMTLLFLGETDQSRISEITAAMKNSIPNPDNPIFMKINEIGQFKRRNENESLIWAGGLSPALSEIHKNLSDSLKKAGFNFDQKPFVPHITLARRVQFKAPIVSEKEIEDFLKSISADFETKVDRICLMSSDLTPDGPIYNELFQISF